jgi:wobble nucleotide-excising tRNase
LENDSEPKLIIKSNSFTDWIFQEQGQDQNIIANFQRYTDDKLTPRFNQQYLKDENDPTSIVRAFSEVSFSFKRGDENSIKNIKISRGEESNFIWSVFYTLLKQVISVKNDEESSQFDSLEYIFIDDPVSSLDENHLIELAIDLSQLIKSSNFEKHKLRFIISTHNPLFYNVLYNELEINKKKSGYMLTKNEDGTFELNEKHGDSNKNFSYHLFLIETIKQAVKNNGIEKFHFMLLRNLYEKTASFLGYPQWSQLLPTEARDSYVRYINLYSHKSL